MTEIDIRAAPAAVTALAFDLPAWPSFLPHYRWVRVLEQDDLRQTVEMACYRGRLPLKWRSHLWMNRDAGTMRFRHVAGPARGMEVEWQVTPRGDGSHVRIVHDLALEVPLVRTAIGQWIVGEFFVGAVAGRTLAYLKEAVERGAVSG